MAVPDAPYAVLGILADVLRYFLCFQTRLVFMTPKITPSLPLSLDQGIAHHAPGFSLPRSAPSNLTLPQ
jgi:hypothetical protein